MKRISLLLLVLISLNTIAQKNNINAIYKATVIKGTNSISSEARALILEAASIVEEFEFILIANTNQAEFKKQYHLSSENTPDYMYRLAFAFCSGDEIWYNSKGSPKKYVKKTQEDLGTLFLEEDLNWQITNETKNIAGYQVVKATTKRNRGTQVETAEAWFTPHLNYAFGPLGYDGLPGLILELTVGKMVSFKLKEIKYTSQEPKNPSLDNVQSFTNFYNKLEKEVDAIKARGY